MRGKYWFFLNTALILILLELAYIAFFKKEDWQKYHKYSSPKSVFVKKWNREEFCITCHYGIESISPSHPVDVFGCVVCHGGDPLSLNVEKAHKGLIGGDNPSKIEVAMKTCGTQAPDGTKCHSDKVKRVKTSLMMTMAGVISSLKYQCNEVKSKVSNFATLNVSDSYGKSFKALAKKDFCDDYFRKKCAMCHVGVKNPYSTSNHSAGCSACHVLYDNGSTYRGKDPTIDRREKGKPPFHRITAKIPVSQCLKCHNRSSRYGTSYIGIAENDFYPVPLIHGEFSKNRMLGGRYFFHLQKDIHYEKGMHCIDCHTSKEVMGDGRLRDRMFEQVYVKCEDCHGSFYELPKTYIVKPDDPLLNVSTYNLKSGDEIVITEKGDYLWNVKKEKDGFYLYGKVENVRLKIKMIYRDENHKPNICNSKLECYSCHFSWTVMCYGCHVGYDGKRTQRDALTGKKTKGYWFERRSYIRYTDIVLIKNARNKYSPAQFCQLQINNKVFIHDDNTTSYVVAPVQPHTITRASKRCADCHNNPMAVGLGRGSLTFYDNGSFFFQPIYDSKGSGLSVDFPMESVVGEMGRVRYQSVSDDRFKILTQKEIKKILDVGRCTICHDSYSDSFFDYYKKGLPCPFRGIDLNKEVDKR